MVGDDKLGRAIATVNKAIEADKAGDYEKALDIYQLALKEFLHIIKWEKNPKSKEMIKAKAEEYMERAEKLRNFVGEKKDGGGGGGGGGGKPGLMGVNGAGKGKGGGDSGDDENKKLKDALSGSIMTEKPNVRWEDIAGLEDAKDTLKEAVVLPIKFPQLFTGNRKAWRGILLYGPPGTGKSYLAKAVATEANSTFFSVSSSDLVSKWMGESEKLVRNLFGMARENKPSVIFIDEIDALCGPRGEGESEASRRIKTEFLVQMDGVGNNADGILLLAATNIPWQLDSAILRRFQRRVHIGLPDHGARVLMLKMGLGDAKVDLSEPGESAKKAEALEPARLNQFWNMLGVRTEGYSGSDISNAMQQALMRPVRKIIQATHFKPVVVGAKTMYTPCSPGDDGALEMTYNDVESDDLLEPTLKGRDLEIALMESRPTVGRDDMQKQKEWTQQFGSEGA